MGVTSFPSFPISVLLSDLTTLGCEVLSAALHGEQGGVAVVGQVVSSKELVELAKQKNPDVALVSIALQESGLAGLTALRQLQLESSRTATVLVVDSFQPEVVNQAVIAGAKGVFVRGKGGIKLLHRCIRIVYEGGLWLPGEMLAHLALRKPPAFTFRDALGHEILTARQKELVSFVASGLSNREIAGEMHVSEHTIKNYLLRIFDKVGVSSRAELIVHYFGRQPMAS